jgi:protein-tyrosine phosphatase
VREVIPKLLWIGNARDARSVSEVLNAGIKAIVDLAIEEPLIVFPRDIVYARLPLLDGMGNDPTIIRAAVSMTAMLITGRVSALVACSGGMSRSPAIVAAAVASVRGTPMDEALRDLARHGPHDVVPGLWAEIQAAFEVSADQP